VHRGEEPWVVKDEMAWHQNASFRGCNNIETQYIETRRILLTPKQNNQEAIHHRL
jgi:hypothetical protein